MQLYTPRDVALGTAPIAPHGSANPDDLMTLTDTTWRRRLLQHTAVDWQMIANERPWMTLTWVAISWGIYEVQIVLVLKQGYKFFAGIC